MRCLIFLGFLSLVLFGSARAFGDQPDDLLFQIGRPDASPSEFGRNPDWQRLMRENQKTAFRFVVGKHRAVDWPVAHMSTRDFGNAGKSFTIEIEFSSDRTYDQPLYFVVGAAFAHPSEPSLIKINLNGRDCEPKRQPMIALEPKYDKPPPIFGAFESAVLEIPPGAVVPGQNVLSLTLEDGSWLVYDYIALRRKSEPLPRFSPPDLLKDFREGPMRDVREILFVVRKPGEDEHWYANFGYYAADENTFPFPLGTGGSLRILNLDSGEVRTIFEDEGGSIRDPQVHYDGKKAVFSYLPKGKRHYNLYEIDLDGSNLRQLTFGDWDDIEPTYLPNGDIVFCSSRSRRWVQCWLTQVATLHRCGPNGENVHELSANVEQDNTPWVLPNGQVLYMRWEYVDRSQVHYHHLWTMNPDGSRQMVYYGNLHPDIVMLGAKPIPGSEKIVAVFSPGHGRTEHYGPIVVVDPKKGPDDLESVRQITLYSRHTDPWAFSEEAFLAASMGQLSLLDGDGYEQTLYVLPQELREAGYWAHEPRPILVRQRERIIPDLTDRAETTGRLALVNIYEGRKMQDLAPGSIKELLVLETLPEPIHYSGGMDQISAGGTFTLERIVGTVPLDPDGSAFMELPALRSFLFVALDHEGKPVKRMHSFTSVMPGETTTCIGCHEQRTQAPDSRSDEAVFRRIGKAPTKPKPVEGVPEVFDFSRDIQPILDRHCLECHNHDRMDAGINFSGDWSPLYTFSYLTLSRQKLLGDNRNRPMSNFGPYEIGSSASRLMQLIETRHEGVALSEPEKKTVRFWLDVGANYAGTYAANGTGLIGWPYRNKIVRNDLGWPETQTMIETFKRRCDRCHTPERNMTFSHSLSDDPARFSRHFIYNLSYPEKSRVLRAPLSKVAGGLGICEEQGDEVVFANAEDADYRSVLAGIARGRDYILNESNRFSMSPFVANRPYTREMIRYGVLPENHDPTQPIDPYATDRKYWELLWHRGTIEH